MFKLILICDSTFGRKLFVLGNFSLHRKRKVIICCPMQVVRLLLPFGLPCIRLSCLFRFNIRQKNGELKHLVGLLGGKICPLQALRLQRITQRRTTWTYIHALNGIRTRNLTVLVAQDRKHLTSCSYWDPS
jgi:hypothetical protein